MYSLPDYIKSVPLLTTSRETAAAPPLEGEMSLLRPVDPVACIAHPIVLCHHPRLRQSETAGTAPLLEGDMFPPHLVNSTACIAHPIASK